MLTTSMFVGPIGYRPIPGFFNFSSYNLRNFFFFSYNTTKNLLDWLGSLLPKCAHSLKTQDQGVGGAPIPTGKQGGRRLLFQISRMVVPTVERFLCCCQLKTGVLIIGAVNLVSFQSFIPSSSSLSSSPSPSASSSIFR